MKHIQITIILFLLTFSVSAQQKLEKISQSIKVTDDVTIDLNTSYTNIEIDTWNKDIIEVEAYIESSTLTKEELKKQLDSWKVFVDGSSDSVFITSNSGNQSWTEIDDLFEMQSFDALKGLEFELANMPIIPMVEGLLESLNLESMPQMPQMPNLPDLPEGINNFSFDYERYQEEGEKYMDKWSKEYSEKYGEDYAVKMDAWAIKLDSEAMKKYEQEMEAWGEKFGNEFEGTFAKDMEKWGEEFGEKFGKDMEEWGEEFGEKFGEDMEKWGEEFGKKMEEQAKLFEENAEEYEDAYQIFFEAQSSKNLKVKKTIKIKIPKNAKLKINVKHGELKIASLINNIKADLMYATLLANSIDGEKTSINASYTSLLVKEWNMGSLTLNFVEDAILNEVNGLVLNSNSSNIEINKLSGNSIINGSFGDLIIRDIQEDFNNINITLDNSDASIKLPKLDFNLQYQGKNSRLYHPENKEKASISSFNLGSLKNSKTIVINAKYSKIIIE